MENFSIRYNTDDEPEPIKPTSLFQTTGMHGRAVPLQMQGFWVWAEDNDAESVMVHVAEKRRVAIADVPEDAPFSIFSGRIVSMYN